MSSTAAQAALLADVPIRRPRRRHRVTAVLVAHNGERWLPRALESLARLQRRPDRLVMVDTGSTDNTVELLAASGLADEVVELPAGTSFAAAVREGVRRLDAPSAVDLRDEATTIDLRDDPEHIDLREGTRAADAPVDWVWLLHDDCSAAPDALQRLLNQADDLSDAAVIGPKLRGWGRPDVLQECGVALSGAGRPERGVGRGEVDQGQLDGRTDVMAVSSAGMLVRRDIWDRLGGLSPSFPAEGADLDLCWRARRAGERVVVAPTAVVHHRRAATSGRRDVADRGSRRYRHRRAAVITALVHAPWWRLPFTAVRVAIAGLLRCLLALVMLAPRRAADELAGTAVGLLSWRTTARGRRDVRRTSRIPERRLRHLRPTLGQRTVHLSEQVVAPKAAGAGHASRRWNRFLRAVAGVVVGLGVLCLLAGWGLWFGDGRIAGAALQPAPDGMSDLLAGFASPWHEVGLGSAVAAPPYLVLVGAASAVTLGSATTAVQILVLAAPVLAAVSLMVALRGLVRRPVAVVAGVAYALLPATLAAVDTGRLGIAVAAVLLPPTVRVLARCARAPGPLPTATARTWAAAAFLSAALAAFSPASASALLVAALLFSLVAGRLADAGRLVLVALAAAALLMPWSGAFVGHPGSVLLDIGAHPGRLAADQVPAWQVAVLSPGGPAAPPSWLAVGLVLLALLALVPSRTRAIATGAWALVLTGLALAVLQNVAEVSVVWSETPVAAWPGAGTLLMGLGMVLAVAAALSGLRRTAFRVGLAAAALTPLLVGGWWLAEGESLLRRSEPVVISPFVTVASIGPEAPRSLDLSQRPDGTIEYEILSGVGPRLGDADMAPPVDGLADFGSAVSRMAAGSGDGLEEVAGWAVRYVTVGMDTDRELARQLDAVPGLRRVSTIDGQGLWEVTRPVPRVAAVTPDGLVPLAADVVGPAVTAAAPLPGGTTAVRVAESPSEVWQADLTGVELTAVAGTPQVFAVPPGASGDVTVGVSAVARMIGLAVPLVAALILVVVAMWPSRREETR